MRNKLCRLVRSYADVVVPNTAVAAAGRHHMAFPRQHAYSRLASAHGPYLAACFCVPNLHISITRAHGQIRAIPRPFNAGHIHIALQLTQTVYIPRSCVPQVHALVQPNRQHITRRPVQKIEIIVVNKPGRVQHAFGRSEYAAFGSMWFEHRPRDLP
ncbi:hypothetical protein IWW41_003234 [Coemansia sp. RSA 2522]|nr:hypothetical protein IWW41_003234 [Coemansia sp. RSA 2522]